MISVKDIIRGWNRFFFEPESPRPIAVYRILLGLVELAVGSQTWLWGAAILFVLGRLALPFGLARPGANALRVGGMVATWLPLLGLAVFALIVSYDTRPARDELDISPVRSSSSEASGGTKLS